MAQVCGGQAVFAPEREAIHIRRQFRVLSFVSTRRGVFGGLMKRREFLTLGGSAAVSSVSRPLPMRAQQPAPPVIGFLHGESSDGFADMLDARASNNSDL